MLGANQVVTVWNRYRDEDNLDAFHRTIIPVLCKYETKIVRTVTSPPTGGLATTILSNIQVVIIPYTPMYLAPKEWLPWWLLHRNVFWDDEEDWNDEGIWNESDEPNCFTLQVNDLIALGEHDTEITMTSPNRESEILQQLGPNIFRIKAVQDNTLVRLGRGWKVEGV